MRIVDFNFLADPNFIAGHKDFYTTNGGVESLIMQEDVVLHLVDQSVYETRRKELLGSEYHLPRNHYFVTRGRPSSLLWWIGLFVHFCES